MDHVCMVLPVAPGKAEALRAMTREMEGARRAGYERSERRIGIAKEAWFLGEADGHDVLCIYMESADFARALELYGASDDDFDTWAKERLAEVSGLDLNDPGSFRPPELLTYYSADGS